MLYKVNKEHADELIRANKEFAINRINYYKSLENKLDA